MIQIVLRIAAAPGRVKEMIQALRSISALAQPQEGCAGCFLFADIGAPESLCYTEEWETEAHLQRQILSFRFTHLLWVMESASEPPHLLFHFVTHTRGLDYVEQVRSRGQNSTPPPEGEGRPSLSDGHEPLTAPKSDSETSPLAQLGTHKNSP